MPYERFIFESFHFDHARRCLTLLYSLDEKILFEEELLFPEGINYSENQLREKLFFNLHLIAGISYYKTYCPKKIEVRSGRLSGGQAAFWDKLYTKGLGQFFYE
ncbi:MAG: hypothetical protein HYT34_01080, partial [Candidatus Ryanbacteria bacterium]|nr:hypothetical protein [Candidatus Ryanbacteria bacterium]